MKRRFSLEILRLGHGKWQSHSSGSLNLDQATCTWQPKRPHVCRRDLFPCVDFSLLLFPFTFFLFLRVVAGCFGWFSWLWWAGCLGVPSEIPKKDPRKVSFHEPQRPLVVLFSEDARRGYQFHDWVPVDSPAIHFSHLVVGYWTVRGVLLPGDLVVYFC